MQDATPSLRDRSGTDKKNRAFEHDYAEPLYGPREEIARCPDCGRECLWGDREHLTHRDGCEVAER